MWVYPGFPTPFWGLSGFFVGDLIGKALWELVENAQRFPRHGGRVLCVHGAVSGSVAKSVQKRLRKTSGHGKRLIDEIDLTHKESNHDHSGQA